MSTFILRNIIVVFIPLISGQKFGYEAYFHEQIRKKKLEHSYRVFKKVNRSAANYPKAQEFTWGEKEVTLWCSNDYLGMSVHPEVYNFSS